MKNKTLPLIMALSNVVFGEPIHQAQRKPKRELTEWEKKAKQDDINKHKGLKQFLFDKNNEVHIVWALNHKNAVKKYKKLINETNTTK